MSTERVDWVDKLRESTGCKTWKEYCALIGANYHAFMCRLENGRVSPSMVKAMSNYHGIDLSFLENDDTHCICTTSTSTRETTSRK